MVPGPEPGPGTSFAAHTRFGHGSPLSALTLREPLRLSRRRTRRDDPSPGCDAFCIASYLYRFRPRRPGAVKVRWFVAHPRISVNSLSSLFQALPADIVMWRELEVDHVGLISPKLEAWGWEKAKQAVAEAGLRVSNLSVEQKVLGESIEFAASVGATSVYVCSGAAGSLGWDEAARVFGAEMAPFAVRAREVGVLVAVEPTNPLRADLSFVFSAGDALDLAREADIGVVIDLYSCWYERGLADLVGANLDRVALIQVSDYVLGTYDLPNRAVPGDGDIPLERLLGEILDRGYEGAFDLEVLGPRIEAEGYPSAVRRGVDHMSELLYRLGA
jgi:sugar phosphate isomerase/epimerase